MGAMVLISGSITIIDDTLVKFQSKVDKLKVDTGMRPLFTLYFIRHCRAPGEYDIYN